MYTDVDGLRTSWPATGASTDPRVPMVFAGAGVSEGGSVPDGTTLDRVAPTVSDVLGFERAFPEVRSGTSIAGVADGERPRLVLLIAWKGVGSSELESRPGERTAGPGDRKSTRLNSSHVRLSRMPSSA